MVLIKTLLVDGDTALQAIIGRGAWLMRPYPSK
jgi:hypothetical protein